jgi:hypothetical protein
MLESATNKLLHAPTTRLRESAANGASEDLVASLKMLFDLPEAAQPESNRTDAPAAGESETKAEEAEEEESGRLPN